MKNKLIITSFVVLICISTAFSQGGSNYSVFGIGDLFTGGNASYQAMGGTMTAVPNMYSINVKNPALWGTATATRLMAGYNFNQHLNVTDESTLFQNNGQISGVYALFSVDTGLGISFSFGLHSISKLNYLISNNFQIENSELTQKGRNTFQGTGGLSSAYLGASVKLPANIYLGASLFNVFGPISTISKTEFLESNIYNYEVNKTDYASGLGGRFGLYYNGFKNIGIGAYYEHISDVDFQQETTYSSDIIADTTTTSKFKQKMPSTIGLGVSYQAGKFLLASDIALIRAKDMTYNAGVNSEFRDAIRLSFGFNRHGATSRASDYLDRISYKAGISYQQLYYRIGSSDINEFALSLGGEMPIGIGGILDVAFVFGTRGINTDNLIKEYFGRMFVEVSVGEIWFKPFRRRY